MEKNKATALLVRQQAEKGQQKCCFRNLARGAQSGGI
jgi:hypothetical protein